jgi:hypothetical protein
MSSKLFFVNIFDGINSLSVTPIAERNTNIDLEIKTAYIKDIYNTDEFNSTNMLNNSDIKNFYYNIILESLNLNSEAQTNQAFKNNLRQLKSDFKDLYILSRYRNSSKKSCVSISSTGVINTSDLIGNFKIYNVGKESLDTITFGVDGSDTFTDDRANSVYAEVREYDGIFISKSFIQLTDVTREAYPWDYDGSSYSDISEKILTSFYKCKVYVYIVKNFDFSINQYYYSTYILILRNVSNESQYAQDFTSAISSFATASSLQLNKIFYPFSVIVDSETIEKGQLVDGNLSNLSFDFPSICLGTNGKINTDTSSDTLALDTMACDLGGNIMIQYSGGPVIKLRDDQLCSGNINVAFVRVDNMNSNEVFLYKDLPNLTNFLNVYAFNFSYVKYIKEDGTTEVLVGSASIKTSTNRYVNQTLKTSNYFAYNFDSSYGSQSFTFSYKFEADNAANITNYLIDFRPSIRVPVVRLNLLDDDKVQVVSDYATSLIYYFEGENPATQSITDSANGVNQISTISTVGKYGTLRVEVRNFFYDLDTEESGLFAASSSIDVKKNITIDSLQFRLYRGIAASVFYDSNGETLNEISGNNFSQGDSLSYYYYRASTTTTDFRFRLNYTFSDTLYIRVGSYDAVELVSSDFYILTIDELYAALDEKGETNITIVLKDGTEFIFPFYFKTTYTTTPTVSSVTIGSVVFSDASSASVTFSYSYSQAEKILYEIINQSGTVIDSLSTKTDYSTSAESKTITVDYLTVSEASSITIRVTASSLSASSGVETIMTATLTSSSYTFPLRLNNDDPAVVKFYNDLALTTLAEKLKKGQKIYAKLQLKNTGGSVINPADYYKYIQVDPNSLTFEIAGFSDINTLANGVTFSRVNSHVYSLIVSADTDFSENEITVNVNYIPLYQI